MEKIGVFTNESKDKQLEITKLLVGKLQMQDILVQLPKHIAQAIGKKALGVDEEELFKGSEIVIALGGDGTFLSVARKVCCIGVPILGVNVGNLGFLAEVEKENIDRVIAALMTGDYKIESRMVLEAKVVTQDSQSEPYYSINDIVVSRGVISRVINIEILLNDISVDQIPADGIIISTPTGSTAYSLSAGGPLGEPEMNLMIITPICPHILHARSMVVSDEKQVSIIIEDRSQSDSMLTIDGQEGIVLGSNHRIDIKKSNHLLKIIKISEKNFYDIVRDKLFNRTCRRK